MNNLFIELQNLLANAGIKSSIVSIEYLPKLQFDIDNLLHHGNLCKDFYNEIVSRYNDLHYHFDSPGNFPEAKSIIITATPQPKTRVRFSHAAKIYSIIIPPTYLHNSDEKVFHILSNYLNKNKYKICKAILPEKSLAVHCGLATYGKNNIAYIKGWGSFFRLKSFYSDISCNSNKWQDFKMLEQCNKCTACIKCCPTKAINPDRFLIDAAQCLTYLNEGADEFPQWIDPSWHNCLIGCMICQDVCPVNKELTDWIDEGEEFSESETLMILDGVSKENLPNKMKEKLKRLFILEDYDLLQRNLTVLIDNYK